MEYFLVFCFPQHTCNKLTFLNKIKNIINLPDVQCNQDIIILIAKIRIYVDDDYCSGVIAGFLVLIDDVSLC